MKSHWNLMMVCSPVWEVLRNLLISISFFVTLITSSCCFYCRINIKSSTWAMVASLWVSFSGLAQSLFDLPVVLNAFSHFPSSWQPVSLWPPWLFFTSHFSNCSVSSHTGSSVSLLSDITSGLLLFPCLLLYFLYAFLPPMSRLTT